MPSMAPAVWLPAAVPTLSHVPSGWLAVMIEALNFQERPADCQALVERAMTILRTGFAGYSAPACLTIAEATEIAQDPRPGVLREVLDSALSAAHNVQDP